MGPGYGTQTPTGDRLRVDLTTVDEKQREITSHLEVLRKLSVDLSQASDTESVLRTMARSTMTILGYEDCVIYVVDVAGQSLVQRAAHGPKCPDGEEIINPIRLRFGEGIVGSCAESGTAILVPDTSNDHRYVVDDQARGSELAVPVIDDGQVIAVIDSEHSQVDFYTEADEQALIDVAAIAAARLRTALTLEALRDSVTQLETARRNLDRLAHTDHLTGLMNRRGFDELIRSTLSASDDPVSVALIDVDRFKAINDTHGHGCGDNILCTLADVMRESADDQAITVARLGGDEFAVLGTDAQQVQHYLLGLLGSTRAQQWRNGAARLDVSLSIGMAQADSRDVWGLADEALFVAKAQGRDQLVVYDPDDPNLIELHSDRRWAAILNEAMESDTLCLFGQPIVRTASPEGSPAYYEMLLRYCAPDGTIQSPAQLLAAAERFGLCERLDLWVVEKVIAWLAERPDELHATVNVTAHFVHSKRALSNLAAILDRHQVKPSRLCIEITETIAINDMDQCHEFVRTAHRWGCRIAIDDFGSGWTALPMVRDLGVDVLKIDGSWVQKSTSDQLACSVVSAVVEAANIIGVEVVAEWVETTETLAFMRELGVSCVQGFLTGVPRPLDECHAIPSSIGAGG